MVDIANEHDCNLFVIAGDLFHSRGVSSKDMIRVTRALGKFNGAIVAVLPGNHDYIRPQDDLLWDSFKAKRNEGTIVLDTCSIFDLSDFGINALLYACPCNAKHSTENATKWIRPVPKRERNAVHIGVAHGSLRELSPDFAGQYFPMTSNGLLSKSLDMWLLGHTHIAYPDTAEGTHNGIYFPSTPEPDGFDCKHPGSALLISVDDRKQVRHQRIPTGHYQFHTVERSLRSAGDVRDFEKSCAGFTERDFLKLVLSGRLPSDAQGELREFLDRLKDKVIHLEIDRLELHRAITLDDIDNEYTQDSFPHRLLRDLAKDEPDELALQMAYDLLREVSK